jgi:DNA primase
MALTNLAEEVKARVRMTDILNQYGFHLVMGRMPCPFHNGKDRNFSVKDNRTYRCWVCGEHGDQITFVMRYFGLDFPHALERINDDFRLGLPIGEDAKRQQSEEAKRKAEQAQREAEERRRKIEERKRKAQELRTRYDEALEAFASCDTIMMRCRPISPSSGVSSVYSWAAQNIDRLWYELKEAEADIVELNQREARESV